MEKHSVVVHLNNEIHYLHSFGGKMLKEVLSDAGISFSLVCGGMGRCGKCAVTFIKGAPKETALDRKFFTADELSGGKRLLCRAVVEGDCELFADNDGEEKIVAKTLEVGGIEAGIEIEKYGIAIDIGTTTVAAALIGKPAGTEKCVVMDTAGGINHQRKFGSDVISRISAGEDEASRKEMEKLIKEDVAGLIEVLKQKNGLTADASGKEISLICITGNTTMLHLYSGLEVKSLGSYPYTPVNLDIQRLDGNVVIMPGISAFVGADIVSGIYQTGITKEQGRKRLLIDLGTNGEMAYFDGEEIRCASCAVGPAFEGGGISCGMPSVPGAICDVTIDKSLSVGIKTIGNAAPKGLCGTGLMQAVSELRRLEIIDSTGLFTEEFFDTGFEISRDVDGEPIRITQKDIRNIQLAKAAVYAGAKELTRGEIPDEVFISGGFGANIDIKKIQYLSLLPQEWNDRIAAYGNTALEGAVKFVGRGLCGEQEQLEAEAELVGIAQRAKEVLLAEHDGFDGEYLQAMNFTTV